MENIEAPYTGVLIMREDASGRWHFLHYPEREPLTTDQLDILQENSETKWILITYPKQNAN